ncbi:hypothetical protein K431DRAFT_248454 [Polychaeton citri CBS 116435]|uniref:Tctex-1 n=1 Tax=Polychaeton citri CBS 116435 TaxID=1314669 RepID=A0A9P4Q9W6_9PEZI|nr:hypothetical protein K431DRAFT_248454 [Polychaeton citri CBS 116435]
MASTSTSPIPPLRLRQICNDACDSALQNAAQYDHASTQTWNNSIINKILQSLISESGSSSSSSGEGQSSAPKYKFAVNSTIIQHLSDPRPAGTSTGGTQTGDSAEESISMGADAAKKVGRRGMHSASGAYWNNAKDGMWSHKYEGGEVKGMDIVISILWIAV